MPSIVFKTHRNNLETVAQGRLFPSLNELLHISITFALTVFAWIFFRAQDLQHAFSYVGGIFSSDFFHNPLTRYPELSRSVLCILLIIPFMITEWLGRENNYAIERLAISWPRYVRWGIYAFIIFCIGIFMQTTETAFIYFQF
jgi:hypothetical protein